MKKFKRIYIEITNCCNFRCSFCLDTKREKRYMSKEEFKIVIDKVKENVESVFLHVKGEPLLHKELEEILKICEDAKLDVNITTNGFFLEDKKEILLKSKALRQLNVSIHSIEENNFNKITQDEYINKVINACKYINENSNVIISYRLWNLDDLENLSKDSKILDALKKAYNIENIEEAIQKNHFIKLNKNTYINLDTKFVWPSLNNEVVSKCGSCYGLRQQLGILVDGTVVPCCLDNDGDITLGNIFTQSLQEILESKRARNIVSGFLTGKLVEPLCKRCGFRENKRR